MGQDTNTKTVTLPLQEFTAVDANSLVNSYADDLVANLFEDVDKLLDGDETLLNRLEQDEEAAALPFVEAEASDSDNSEAASTALVPTGPATDGEAESKTSLTTESNSTGTPAQKTRLGKLLDRFLITTTVFSLLGVFGFIVYSYQRSVGWMNPVATQDVDMPSQSDVEFLEYLDRSLDVIARKVERSAATEGAIDQLPDVSVLPASPPLLPPLTPAPTAGGLMPPGGGPVNVIERVYIPYQTTAQQPTLPQVPQMAQAPGQAGVPQGATATPATVHVLVGLLELGERSAALFEINGVSQRVYIGQPIGNSGWNLVSVSSDEARIRRNGEVRSIYIGQQF
jgi:hypothetical protein